MNKKKAVTDATAFIDDWTFYSFFANTIGFGFLFARINCGCSTLWTFCWFIHNDIYFCFTAYRNYIKIHLKFISGAKFKSDLNKWRRATRNFAKSDPLPAA